MKPRRGRRVPPSMRVLLLAVASFIACVLLVPRGRVVAVERAVVVEQYGPWFPPSIAIHGKEVTYDGTREEIDPVELQSLAYEIRWLRAALEQARTRQAATEVERARAEHAARCMAERDAWPAVHILCPARAVIVELAGDYEGAVVNRVLYTAWRAGYEPVVRFAETAQW